MNIQQENGSSANQWLGQSADLRHSRPIGSYHTDAAIAADEDKIREVHSLYLDSEITDAGFLRLAGLKLPLLRELHMFNLKITDRAMVGIEEMTSLDWLNMDNVDVGNVSLVCIRNLPNLVGLQLTRTKISDSGLWKLGRMKQLGYLDLQCNQISDLGLTDLAKMDNLKTLKLDRTNVSDGGLLRLVGMKNLRRLSLRKTKVTNLGAMWLRVLLPECSIEFEDPQLH